MQKPGVCSQSRVLGIYICPVMLTELINIIFHSKLTRDGITRNFLVLYLFITDRNVLQQS
jgi:hypothetical protein